MVELWPFLLGFGLVYKCIYLHMHLCVNSKMYSSQKVRSLRRTTVHVGLIHLLLKITCLQIHQNKNQALIPVFTIMHLS